MYDYEICDANRLSLGLLKFSNIRKENMIYVDKTNLIAKIASKRVPVFLSRPRRFGKTLLVNTLSSLFTDGLKYFYGLDIEKKWNDKKYKVVHLDFSSLADKSPLEFKRDFNESIIEEFGMKGIVAKSDEIGIRSPDRVMNDIAKRLDDNSIVLLIDEYDAPLVHNINNPDELMDIMKILNNFYAVVKQYIDAFRFMFITGVTRVSHISIFSVFNNLIDISLDDEFNQLLGFTQNDLEKYYDPYIENAAKILKMSKNDIYQEIKQYYDGFQFSLGEKETVYNPWSLLNFFSNPKKGFFNYWFKYGGISSIIMKYVKINGSFDFFNYKNREILIDEDELSDIYEIDKIPYYLLLYQAGYFTIRVSDGATYLILPNGEVEQSLFKLYLTANNLNPQPELYDKMRKLSHDIDKKDLRSIINTFNCILNEYISSSCNIFEDERSVRDIIYAALTKVSSLQKIKERDIAKGKSDLELITNNTSMIIEFKRTYPNRGPEASLNKAIEQIKENRYGILFSRTRHFYRVAMVISTEKKEILYDFSREVR